MNYAHAEPITTPRVTIGDFEPLALLVMLRAILAMRGWPSNDLRRMSLRDAIVNVGHMAQNTGLIGIVKDLRSITDLGLREAKELVDACIDIAEADLKLSVIVEPDRRVIAH